MKKHVLAAILGASMLFSAQAATLHVGTEATFAPFEFMDEQTKELTGFDMELITAVAKAMGDDVKIQNMGFDGLIPSLQTRIIDVTAAAMTITPERVKRIDFSEPYYQSGLEILVKKDNLDKVLKAVKGKDKAVLTFMFLFPFFPDDILCFVSGLSSMSTAFFIVMIVITRFISIFISCFAYDGALIPYDTWWGLLLWGVFIAVTVVLTIVIYKKGDKIEAFFKDKFSKKKKNCKNDNKSN